MYGDPIKRSDTSASGWSNALLCPICGTASLRFATVPTFIEECMPTNDSGSYIDLYCTHHRCHATATLAVRQHAGILHLTLVSSPRSE